MLSVVIIAKNESVNLPRCLASVKDLADEVVVVDSDSTDGTADVAASWGATVHQRAFTTYADQKNWAADQATQPYVLSLDADEVVGEALLAELKTWKSQASQEAGPPQAWSVPRLTNYCGTWVRHGGWYPDRKIRLWKAGTGSWKTAHPGATLHESWVPNAGTEVMSFSGDLLHYSYHSTEDHQRQLAKFSILGAVDAAQAGRSSHAVKPVLRVHCINGSSNLWFSLDSEMARQVGKWRVGVRSPRFGSGVLSTLKTSEGQCVLSALSEPMRWETPY